MRESYPRIREYMFAWIKFGKVIINENIKHLLEVDYEISVILATVVKNQVEVKNLSVAAVYCTLSFNSANYYVRLFQTIGNQFIIGVDF